jgi:uncharacterized membrane protein YcjF (UPF0283 family)
MFNLEQSIAEWRQQMLAAGIEAPVPLEELEAHLREEIERQMRTGYSAELAFEIAAGQIGPARLIQTEFTKVERNSMKRMTYIMLGIFGVLFGMALVLPAWAWFRNHHAVAAQQLAFFLVGLLIVASGLGSAIYGLKKRTA